MIVATIVAMFVPWLAAEPERWWTSRLSLFPPGYRQEGIRLRNEG